jgi:hypothetical protein
MSVGKVEVELTAKNLASKPINRVIDRLQKLLSLQKEITASSGELKDAWNKIFNGSGGGSHESKEKKEQSDKKQQSALEKIAEAMRRFAQGMKVMFGGSGGSFGGGAAVAGTGSFISRMGIAIKGMGALGIALGVATVAVTAFAAAAKEALRLGRMQVETGMNKEDLDFEQRLETAIAKAKIPMSRKEVSAMWTAFSTGLTQARIYGTSNPAYVNLGLNPLDRDDRKNFRRALESAKRMHPSTAANMLRGVGLDPSVLALDFNEILKSERRLSDKDIDDLNEKSRKVRILLDDLSTGLISFGAAVKDIYDWLVQKFRSILLPERNFFEGLLQYNAGYLTPDDKDRIKKILEKMDAGGDFGELYELWMDMASPIRRFHRINGQRSETLRESGDTNTKFSQVNNVTISSTAPAAELAIEFGNSSTRAAYAMLQHYFPVV